MKVLATTSGVNRCALIAELKSTPRIAAGRKPISDVEHEAARLRIAGEDAAQRLADSLAIDQHDGEDGAGLDHDLEHLGLIAGGVGEAEQRAGEDEVAGARDRQEFGQALDDAHQGGLEEQDRIQRVLRQSRHLSRPMLPLSRAAGSSVMVMPLSVTRSSPGPHAPPFESGNVLRPQRVDHLIFEQGLGQGLAEAIELALPVAGKPVDDEALDAHVDETKRVVARLEAQAFADEKVAAQRRLRGVAVAGVECQLDGHAVAFGLQRQARRIDSHVDGIEEAPVHRKAPREQVLKACLRHIDAARHEQRAACGDEQRRQQHRGGQRPCEPRDERPREKRCAHSSGTASSSFSHTVASESLGARQSPRGESDPPEPTLGAFGATERLNWLVWKKRCRKLPRCFLIAPIAYSWRAASRAVGPAAERRVVPRRPGEEGDLARREAVAQHLVEVEVLQLVRADHVFRRLRRLVAGRPGNQLGADLGGERCRRAPGAPPRPPCRSPRPSAPDA